MRSNKNRKDWGDKKERKRDEKKGEKEGRKKKREKNRIIEGKMREEKEERMEGQRW